MGRTVPTWRGRVEREIEALLPYRRALRSEERPAFDAMMRAVRQRRAAGGMLVELDPMQPMLLSMLLESYTRLHALERRLAIIEVALTEDDGDET